MISSMLTIILVWAIATSSFAMVQPTQGRSGGNRTLEPNLHVPNLYADEIDLIAVLVDLPGSKKGQSYWELSYQLFFVPEAEYLRVESSLYIRWISTYISLRSLRSLAPILKR